ncbi:MAG: hypothetical protein ACRD3V_09525 [Vicinamibacteria bacterium]
MSLANGREPEPDRWDVDRLRMNSFSLRFTLNPTPDWSVQTSFGVDQPEQIHQGIDVIRVSASATYNRPFEGGNWQTTIAWGRNKRERTFRRAADFLRRLSSFEDPLTPVPTRSRTDHAFT